MGIVGQPPAEALLSAQAADPSIPSVRFFYLPARDKDGVPAEALRTMPLAQSRGGSSVTPLDRSCGSAIVRNAGYAFLSQDLESKSQTYLPKELLEEAGYQRFLPSAFIVPFTADSGPGPRNRAGHLVVWSHPSSGPSASSILEDSTNRRGGQQPAHVPAAPGTAHSAAASPSLGSGRSRRVARQTSHRAARMARTKAHSRRQLPLPQQPHLPLQTLIFSSVKSANP